MIIGITGRGGTGKSTLAKSICDNHSNFIHLEGDKIVEDYMENNTEYLNEINETVGKRYGKKYSFDDAKKSVLENSECSIEIRKIFLKTLNQHLKKFIENNQDKNIVVEHFLLHELDVYNLCDTKILLEANIDDRLSRVKKRGNMSRELYLQVDALTKDDVKIEHDVKFNIENYRSELISVIIPAYNCEKYVEKTIKSILNQSYKNLELIVVNDGSTDGTLKILNDIAKKDNRVKVITTENKNVSNARNTGIDAAKGEYICFVDSDDIINENYLLQLYDGIKLFDGDFSQSSVNVCDENLKGKSTNDDYSFIVYNNPVLAFQKLNTPFAVWSKLYKADVIKNTRFPDLKCFEDFIYMWEIAKKSKKAIGCGDAVYNYVQRNKNSLTNGCYSELNLELINHAKKVLTDSNYSDSAKRYFYGCIFHNITLFLKSVDKSNFDKNKYKKEIYECLMLLEKYKDYKFEILTFNQSNIDAILKKAKDIVSSEHIAIIWNKSYSHKSEIIDDLNQRCLINSINDIHLNKDNYINFIKRIYPNNDNNYWKTLLKVKYLLNENDAYDICVLNLSLLNNNYKFDERKHVTINSEVIDIKNYIRNKYSLLINDYHFDNIFHMTDDDKEYYNTNALMSEYLNDIKRLNGRLLINNNNLKTFLSGKRDKYCDDEWIFKIKRKLSFEDYEELFAEEVFNLFGLDNAYYDLEIYNDYEGVITKKFDINKKFIDFYGVISDVIKINDINYVMKFNNLSSIYNVINIYCKKHGYSFERNFYDKLYKLFLIDISINQTDRNPYNYGIIIDDNLVKLAPIYDNSNSLHSNHPNENDDKLPILNYNSTDNICDTLCADNNVCNDLFDTIKFIENNFDYIFRQINLKLNQNIPMEVENHIKTKFIQNIEMINKILSNKLVKRLK